MADSDFHARMMALMDRLPNRRRITLSAPVQNVAVLASDSASAARALRLTAGIEHKIGSSIARFACASAGAGLTFDAFAAAFGQNLKEADIDIVVLEAGVISSHDLNATARWLLQLPAKPAVICCPGQLNEQVITETCQEAERRQNFGPAPVIIRSLATGTG